MNMRLACDLCGSQPCMCLETECLRCKGEGSVEHPALTAGASCVAESPPDPPMIECEDCDGTGQVKCDGPREGGRCKFAPPSGIPGDYHCYCESAWERQQEDYASEPPPSARERQEQAQNERDALRSGRPI